MLGQLLLRSGVITSQLFLTSLSLLDLRTKGNIIKSSVLEDAS